MTPLTAKTAKIGMIVGVKEGKHSELEWPPNAMVKITEVLNEKHVAVEPFCIASCEGVIHQPEEVVNWLITIENLFLLETEADSTPPKTEPNIVRLNMSIQALASIGSSTGLPAGVRQVMIVPEPRSGWHVIAFELPELEHDNLMAGIDKFSGTAIITIDLRNK